MKHITEVSNPTLDDVYKQIDREAIEDEEITNEEYKAKWNEDA